MNSKIVFQLLFQMPLILVKELRIMESLNGQIQAAIKNIEFNRNGVKQYRIMDNDGLVYYGPTRNYSSIFYRTVEITQ